MRKFTVLLTMFLCFSIGMVFGQGRSISGSVVDSESGTPLVGASVEIVGAQDGTVTDENGNFSLTMPDGYTKIKIMQLGYATQELTATNGMVVRLVSTSIELTKAEVVGAMGQKLGKGYVGSASTVSEEEIEKRSPTDITKALTGAIPGAQVVVTTGQPGVSASVKLRGTHSLGASTGVLYVVDGVPFGGDISSIDPNDIVSTTTLKDASAAALYGARGSNGVILITTKKGTAGTEGKIQVDLKMGGNFRWLPMYDFLKSPEQYMEVSAQGVYNFLRLSQGQSAAESKLNDMLWRPNPYEYRNAIPVEYNMWDSNDIIDPKTGKFRSGVKRRYTPEDWQKNIFHNGIRYEGSVKISGGADKTKYYTSVGFLKDEGYYIQSDFKRVNALTNLDYSPKKWLEANFKAQYAYATMNAVGQSSRAANNGFYFINAIPPIYPVFRHEADGSIAKDPYGNGGNAYDFGHFGTFSRPFSPGINPAGALRYDKDFTSMHNLLLSNVLKFEFVKDLVFTITNGYNLYAATNSTLMNAFYGDASGVGHALKTNQTIMDFSSMQTLTYKKTFEDQHNTDFLLGHDFRNQESKIIDGAVSNLFKPYDYELSNGTQYKNIASTATDYRSESYFAQARYNFAERYFVQLNGSVYGSSYFAPGHRYGAFWSVGAAWNLHREVFMSSARKVLSNFKVKANFGTTGNDRIGNYNYVKTYSIQGIESRPAVIWASTAEPTLTWEKTYKLNTGIEFELWKGRIYGEIEYYYDLITNNLTTRPVTPSMGYGAVPINQGKFANYGVDVLLKSKLVDKRNFTMNLTITAAYNDAKLKELPTQVINGKEIELISHLGAIKNHSINEIKIREYLGVDPKNGFPIYRTYKDKNKKDDGGNIAWEPKWVTEPYTYVNDVTVKDGQVVKKHPRALLEATETYSPSRAASSYIGKKWSPNLFGGFSLDFSTYGFDFTASFDYMIGGYGIDYTYANLMNDHKLGTFNYHKDILNAWSYFATAEQNNSTNVPLLFSGETLLDVPDKDAYFGKIKQFSLGTTISDRFLISRTGLRLSNVRIGYTFPKKLISKIKMENLNVWVSGDNLMVISHRKGYNPFEDMYSDSDLAKYSPLSTILAGIKFSF